MQYSNLSSLFPAPEQTRGGFCCAATFSCVRKTFQRKLVNLSQSAVTNQNQRKTVKKRRSVRKFLFPCRRSDLEKRHGKEGSRKRKMAQTKQRKVALMGFRSVGKSSLAIQFVQVSTLPLMIKSSLKLPFLLHTTMFFYIYVPRFVLRTTSVLIQSSIVFYFYSKGSICGLV